MENEHDPLCENYNGSCCPWMGGCECQCTCSWLESVRVDERLKIYYKLKSMSKLEWEEALQVILQGMKKLPTERQ